MKLFCRPATGVVIGGVVVAPDASELIFPLTLAVQRGLTVDDLAEQSASTRRCPARSPRPRAG